MGGKRGKLTPKQEAFVLEYLVDLNATAAAGRAGYRNTEIGRQLITKNNVSAAIQVAMNKRSARTEITADRVLKEIAVLAFSDVKKLFDDQGRLLPVQQLPDEVSRFVSSIEVDQHTDGRGDEAQVVTTRKIKLWDKRGSLELLGKHLKLFTERIEADITERRVILDGFGGDGGQEDG